VIALLVDQNFNEHILDGLIRRGLTAEFVHVRDVGLAAARAPEVLVSRQ
jgi:predicted nuclease of predicted toxin-antitoxin system